MEVFAKLSCMVGEDIADHDGSNEDGIWKAVLSLLERGRLIKWLVEELSVGSCGMADNTVAPDRSQMLIKERKNRMAQGCKIVENSNSTVLEHDKSKTKSPKQGTWTQMWWSSILLSLYCLSSAKRKQYTKSRESMRDTLIGHI